MRTTLKTMPSETVGQGRTRIAELVEALERHGRRDKRICQLMDQNEPGTDIYGGLIELALQNDEAADLSRAELRAIIGCDPYRLAAAIGA